MTDKDEPKAAAPGDREGLGFEDLSMNELPSAQPVSEGEAQKGGGRLALVVVGVLAVVIFLVVGMRLISNAHPGREAETRLRLRLTELPFWQQGTVMEAHYLAGDRVRLDFNQRLSPADEEDEAAMEDATREVLFVLMAERPRRDLFIEGYQGDEEVLRAEYRHKSTLLRADGQPVPDISIRLKGHAGGLGGAFGEGSGARR